MSTPPAISLAAALAFIAASAVAGPLYVVERPGVAASYIYGTLHSGDPRVSSLPAPVVDALDRSRRLAPELVMGEGDLADYVAAAVYDDDRRLADTLDDETIRRVRAALAAKIPDESTFARLKPWAVLRLLVQGDGESAGPTLDTVLLAEAKRRRMTVIGLELPEEQVASFDAIPAASQAALVRWVLDRRGRLAEQHEASVRAWLGGDLARLRRQAIEPGLVDPALKPHLDAFLRHLVEDRTELMAHRLHLPLRSGRVFVAVGALHLDGPRGLIALLRAQGYRVRRLKRRAAPRC